MSFGFPIKSHPIQKQNFLYLHGYHNKLPPNGGDNCTKYEKIPDNEFSKQRPKELFKKQSLIIKVIISSDCFSRIGFEILNKKQLDLICPRLDFVL